MAAFRSHFMCLLRRSQEGIRRIDRADKRTGSHCGQRFLRYLLGTMSDPQPNPPESNGSSESDSAPVSKGTQPSGSQPNDPLHGVTLKAMVEYLVDEYGWERLGERIRIDCFTYDPSINSSLKFLRKTEWARVKVERLYLDSISYDERKGKRASQATETPAMPGNVWERARHRDANDD